MGSIMTFHPALVPSILPPLLFQQEVVKRKYWRVKMINVHHLLKSEFSI